MNPILKRVLTGLTVAAAVVAAVLLAPFRIIPPTVAALGVLAIAEFALLMRRKFPVIRGRAALWFLAGCAAIAFGLCPLVGIAAISNARFGSNLLLLYVLAIIKFSDTGGFAFGVTSAKLMKGGNHKLCPTISPNKSWEGLFGSVLCSAAVSLGFMPFTHFGWAKAFAFGVAAALLGTAGDLAESKFKRWVGVKDSSAMKITNGMGGILDMMDSLLVAPAALMAFI